MIKFNCFWQQNLLLPSFHCLVELYHGLVFESCQVPYSYWKSEIAPDDILLLDKAMLDIKRREKTALLTLAVPACAF